MYLLFDIGGTYMRLAVTSDNQTFSEPKIIETPKDFHQGMEIFKKTALEISGGQKIIAAAGGVRALDKTRQKMVVHPLIKLWDGEPLHDELQKAINAPVYLENDTAMVGLGEATYGAGKGYRIVAYISISTGVGGVRVVDGKIDLSSMGFEPGHQVIIDLTDNSRMKYLEEYISGYSIEERFKKQATQIESFKFWDEVAQFLAIGLNNTIVHWSPDIVVLGGGMMKNIQLERVKFHLQEILKIFPETPLIVPATLGGIGGLYGAMRYLNPQNNP